MTYAAFLERKRFAPPLSGMEPNGTHPSLFPFQAAITRWALRRGRAAVFADCGLGKTRIQIDWAVRTAAPALIVAPLAVSEQTIREGAAMGVEIGWAEDGIGPITTINYERLHKLDPADYQAIVLDESSILKSVDGKTRTRLLREWTVIPYRLCCTATPAPNDLAELANHAEFLGIMSRPEMLATFFVHDDREWRIKGHAQEAFWEWMASWSVYLRQPSDLGFDDADFRLPELTIREIVVPMPKGAGNGSLFPHLERGITGRSLARRLSLPVRVDAAYERIAASTEQWVVWCGLNAEQDALAYALGPECVSIAGVNTEDEKIDREQRWRSGEARVLLTKPSIFGWGMNWQHCHRVAFLGLGDSYEQYYQAIRRCWRFGQTEPVEVDVIVSDAEGAIVANVWRKEEEAKRVAANVIDNLRDLETASVRDEGTAQRAYEQDRAEGDGWIMLQGDSAERLREIPDRSLGLSVFSPPFASLYTYSASDRDLGNSRSYEQFFEHFGFIAGELLRATMPGRRACCHVQQVTTTKATHGEIGWRDFRADTVRLFQSEGWVYDGEIVIDKDPQAQAIRTKSKALLFVQKERDAAWLRPAMADYILLFRAPGENLEPVKSDVTNEEWIRWARPIWYGIRETETLNGQVVRSEKDERHIAPLQLETIERCVRLWSNPGDIVADPFAGIGSTGYVALRAERRFRGIELKPEYWRQAVHNLIHAKTQLDLFAPEAEIVGAAT